MPRTVAILATLDTKAAEAAFMKREIGRLGGKALLLDMGVLGEVPVRADVTRDQIARAGGSSLQQLQVDPSRQKASPVMIAGAIKILRGLLQEDKVHAVAALGGTQGTSNSCQVLQALPYGFPKLMLSTVASGDTRPFVDIKDITMMFSVSDILGLNAFSRRILANAAAAAWGMAQVEHRIEADTSAKGTVGMTNLGVLTRGAMHAIDLFHQAGYEVITFHAIGAGGRAMEQMMKDGIITGVFDYALGEIADEVFDGLRAANAERLTVAGKLGLPQVICPGGAEHIGVLLKEPNTVPERWRDHQQTFHNPYVFVPRLNAEEIAKLAKVICERLRHTTKDAVFLMPTKGVSRYSAPGAELEDRESDAAFWQALQANMPKGVEARALDNNAEDPAFVEHAVATLVAMLGR
jgi:uncharacterized protein (UPF0261 family)